MTESEEKSVRIYARERGLELKAHIATLKFQLGEMARAWREVGDALRNPEAKVYSQGEDYVGIWYPQACHSVKLTNFSGASLQDILNDLFRSENDFIEVKKQCDDMGDPL